MCSDGFYHLHSEATIREALHGAKGRGELRRALAELAQAGRQGGETDNMTAVALRWDAAAPMSPATQPLGLEPERTPVFDIQAKVCQIHIPHTAFES